MSSSGRGSTDVQRLQQVIADLAAEIQDDPALAPEQRLRAVMDAYFAFAERRAEDYRAVYLGELSNDPQLRAFVAASLDRQGERLLAILAPDVRELEMVRLAVYGWLRFLVGVCLRWLDEPGGVDREAIGDLCVDTLFSAVAAATRAATSDGNW